MITFETKLPNGHRGRGFFRELLDPEIANAIIADRYWDDDDQTRAPVLHSILARSNVSAIAYPTLGHRDVLQVFLKDSSDQPVFACVLVSGARLRTMLEASSPIVEGFALQVLPSEHLSIESIRAALQSWIERCFPTIVLPNLTLERWTGPQGIVQELLEYLLSSAPARRLLFTTTVDTEPLGELHPDPELAQPPYEDAA